MGKDVYRKIIKLIIKFSLKKIELFFLINKN